MGKQIEGLPPHPDTSFGSVLSALRKAHEEVPGYINLRNQSWGEKFRRILNAQKGYTQQTVQNPAPRLHVPAKITFYPRDFQR